MIGEKLLEKLVSDKVQFSHAENDRVVYDRAEDQQLIIVFYYKR